MELLAVSLFMKSWVFIEFIYGLRFNLLQVIRKTLHICIKVLVIGVNTVLMCLNPQNLQCNVVESFPLIMNLVNTVLSRIGTHIIFRND